MLLADVIPGAGHFFFFFFPTAGGLFQLQSWCGLLFARLTGSGSRKSMEKFINPLASRDNKDESGHVKRRLPGHKQPENVKSQKNCCLEENSEINNNFCCEPWE